jgi:hypothetical protein
LTSRHSTRPLLGPARNPLQCRPKPAQHRNVAPLGLPRQPSTCQCPTRDTNTAKDPSSSAACSLDVPGPMCRITTRIESWAKSARLKCVSPSPQPRPPMHRRASPPSPPPASESIPCPTRRLAPLRREVESPDPEQQGGLGDVLGSSSTVTDGPSSQTC